MKISGEEGGRRSQYSMYCAFVLVLVQVRMTFCYRIDRFFSSWFFSNLSYRYLKQGAGTLAWLISSSSGLIPPGHHICIKKKENTLLVCCIHTHTCTTTTNGQVNKEPSAAAASAALPDFGLGQ